MLFPWNKKADAKQQELEALREELKKLADDCERYRDEARRYRNEARGAVRQAGARAGRAVLSDCCKNWITDGVPMPSKPYSMQDAGESAYLIYRPDAGKTDFDSYCAALAAAGFAPHFENTEGNALFAFFHNDTLILSVSFATSDNTLRIVVEPKAEGALFPTAPLVLGKEDSAAPCLVQMGDHLYEVVDCGMSYIYRLNDGSFLIIDGGWNTEPIADALYEKLLSLANGSRIVIAAWVFTHAHIDHIGAFYAFSKKYADKVELHQVIHDFPGESRLCEMGDAFVEGYLFKFRSTLARFGSTVTLIKARTGQKFRYAGLVMDMLFTYEDYEMPRPLATFNDTSLVFRITAEGQVHFFLGDASEACCGILVKKYGEQMRSDVVQVAHHGYPGGTKEVYDAIAAPVVLWPCPGVHPKHGGLRYDDPEWSPITREMVRNHAKVVYPLCYGTTTHPVPLATDSEDTI